MLSAGMALRWLRDLHSQNANSLTYEQLAALAADVPPGSDGLFFLPYLVGERSPLMDPQARGAFVGLTLRHGLGHMARAIMEGVAFALRQIIETVAGVDASVDAFYSIGGGLMNGPLWKQIVVDVLACPLRLPEVQQRAAVGAAILGGIASGIYRNYAEAIHATTTPYIEVVPDQLHVAIYAE